MSEDGGNWAQCLPPPVRYALIAALLGVCLFAIGQRFYDSAFGQRMLGIASCPAFAPGITGHIRPYGSVGSGINTVSARGRVARSVGSCQELMASAASALVCR